MSAVWCLVEGVRAQRVVPALPGSAGADSDAGGIAGGGGALGDGGTDVRAVPVAGGTGARRRGCGVPGPGSRARSGGGVGGAAGRGVGFACVRGTVSHGGDGCGGVDASAHCAGARLRRDRRPALSGDAVGARRDAGGGVGETGLGVHAGADGGTRGEALARGPSRPHWSGCCVGPGDVRGWRLPRPC